VASFGILLIPISLIWATFFFFPLVGLAWMWERVALLRPLLALPGALLAAVADLYACLMPSMGEWDSRLTKLFICRTWPFTLDYLKYREGKLEPRNYERFFDVLQQAHIVPVDGNNGLLVVSKEHWNSFWGQAPLPLAEGDSMRRGVFRTDRG
jgi:hypothetical protein